MPGHCVAVILDSSCSAIRLAQFQHSNNRPRPLRCQCLRKHTGGLLLVQEKMPQPGKGAVGSLVCQFKTDCARGSSTPALLQSTLHHRVTKKNAPSLLRAPRHGSGDAVNKPGERMTEWCGFCKGSLSNMGRPSARKVAHDATFPRGTFSISPASATLSKMTGPVNLMHRVRGK